MVSGNWELGIRKSRDLLLVSFFTVEYLFCFFFSRETDSNCMLVLISRNAVIFVSESEGKFSYPHTDVG